MNFQPASASAAVADRPRDVFVCVFNLRTVAAMFYLCLVLVISKRLLWLLTEPASSWWFDTVFVLRQDLISGACTLVSVGASAAWLTALRARRQVSIAEIGAIIAFAATTGAALGLTLRLVVADFSWPEISAERAHLLGTFALWVVLGVMAAAFYWFQRESARMQVEAAAAGAERLRFETQMDEARLAALQAQIEPHFLFNTLANVKRLYETDATRGRVMLASLITYLRAALPAMRQTGSTVAREIDLVRSYLTILRMRMGDRLRFRIEADAAALDAALPSMVLSTLVENAVKHGLSPLPEGGEVLVSARVNADRLYVDVIDDGAGFSGSGGSGVGLANTRARLVARYGSCANLHLAANWPRGVRASLDLPLELAA